MEGALAAVVVIDDDGVLGDIDGDHGVGVGAAQGGFLSGDHDDPGVRRPALRGDRLDRWPGWWAGLSGAHRGKRSAEALGARGPGDAKQ